MTLTSLTVAETLFSMAGNTHPRWNSLLNRLELNFLAVNAVVDEKIAAFDTRFFPRSGSHDLFVSCFMLKSRIFHCVETLPAIDEET